MERVPRDVTAKKLAGIGLSLDQVEAFIREASSGHEVFNPLRESLEARGLWQYVQLDPGIVRGLAYYTGAVFEVFDLKLDLRAVAGGGRYDNLCKLIGGVDIPCTGFAMGDVVLTELLHGTPGAQIALTDAMLKASALDAYVVIADEVARSHALAAVQSLRELNLRVDYAMGAAKVGKQFQAAEDRKARFAVIFGSEYPQVKIKNLIARTETAVSIEKLAETLAAMLQQPEHGVLIA
jgi:histidyl-tRNA synthetase